MAHDDIFDIALNLEDTSYAEGYAQGVADGSQAGRIEGRIFGLEKGYEKFLDMGRIHGRAIIWNARTSKCSVENTEPNSVAITTGSTRLEKNIEGLKTMTSLLEISTANEEEAVAEFDDCMKRAKSKAMIIERSLGEHQPSLNHGESDIVVTDKGLRVMRTVASQSGGAQDNLEDFGLKTNNRKTS